MMRLRGGSTHFKIKTRELIFHDKTLEMWVFRLYEGKTGLTMDLFIGLAPDFLATGSGARTHGWRKG